MLLSVQTGSILDPFGIDRGFEMIATAGFDGVDINLDHLLPSAQIRANERCGYFDRPEEDRLETLLPYKEAAERNGLRFVQAHAPFPNYVPDEETNAYVLDAVQKTIQLCGFLNCRNLVVHPGFQPTDVRMAPEEEWNYNIRMYAELIPHLRKYGVTCCLENLFSRHRGKVMEAVCASPYEAVQYIDHLNEMAGERLFGFCLDTGHANLVGKDLYAMIRQLGDRFQVLHVHDNNGLEDEHLFPYMGIIDWERFCCGLKEIHYAHDLNFETFRTMDTFAPELAPKLLDLLHETGELLRRKILDA